MPEGPELHLSSLMINRVCAGRIFSGQIKKSDVHKCAEVSWSYGDYEINACSRGKELKLSLCSVKDNTKVCESKKSSTDKMDIVFQFGMSGRFKFSKVEEMEKHSHLNFYTKIETDDNLEVLSFVDYRRFGKWQSGSDWNPERGPCVMTEYQPFRENVLDNLSHSAFNKPICEVMLNQKFFNGIGNYLRAEILYRAGVKPFECARTVLEPLLQSGDSKTIKSETPDILELCSLIPREVIDIGVNVYDPQDKVSHDKFSNWLKCYYKMSNMVDHNKRTIWFSGDPGPLAPKGQKSRRKSKPPRPLKKKKDNETVDKESDDVKKIKEKPNKKKVKVVKSELEDNTKSTTTAEIRSNAGRRVTRSQKK